LRCHGLLGSRGADCRGSLHMNTMIDRDMHVMQTIRRSINMRTLFQVLHNPSRCARCSKYSMINRDVHAVQSTPLFIEMCTLFKVLHDRSRCARCSKYSMIDRDVHAVQSTPCSIEMCTLFKVLHGRSRRARSCMTKLAVFNTSSLIVRLCRARLLGHSQCCYGVNWQ
jgi:hypothetical protein